MLGNDDRRCGMRLARNQAKATLPRLARFIQFRLRAFPLRKHPFRLAVGQMTRHAEQFVEPSHRAGGDNVEFALHSLDLAVGYGDIGQIKLDRDPPEELGTEFPGLVERHRPPAEDGDHHAGKSGTRADVQPTAFALCQAKQLGPVEEMPGPELRHAIRRDQILLAILFDEQRRKSLELLKCVT